jgi:hypothetical protein
MPESLDFNQTYAGGIKPESAFVDAVAAVHRAAGQMAGCDCK